MNRSKRMAANRVVCGDTTYIPGFVESIDGKVVDYGKLNEETAHTEWHQGTIRLVETTTGLIIKI